MDDELQLFIKWTEFLKWLLNTTEKFPKKVRFTFTTRIDNLALDILEDIIEFRYDKRARQSGFHSRKHNIQPISAILSQLPCFGV